MLDASVVVEFTLNTDVGRRIGRRLSTPDESAYAPHLLSVEVLQVLRRYVHVGLIDVLTAAAACVQLDALPVQRYPHELLLPRMWELRDNVTAYDATYVALAEALEAPLLTTDGRLARTPGLRAVIEVLD
ncbi:MAG: type II toxin-antitoxin system VapC family toxin [Ilumatobacteraceae bacterium]